MDNTISIRKKGLDQFYTKLNISKKCIDYIESKYNWNTWDLIIEPSAGNGSFFNQIPSTKKIGIDISPYHNDIIEQDFLTYTPPNTNQNILVLGNPPFGRVSSLAIKFFNHSSKFANVIAFIIPRTFRRISVQNKLNNSFHLIFDEDIPMSPCSFSPPMSAKCCFQIWEKKDYIRHTVKLKTIHNDWIFLAFGPKDSNNQPTPPSGADFAIRAYGGNCGQIEKNNLNNLRPKSWHWIKCNIDINLLINRFNTLDYSLSKDTARQDSIGRAELVKLYSDKYN